MKIRPSIFLIALAVIAASGALPAQTNAPVSQNAPVVTNAPAPRVNPAIIPVARTGLATNRQAVVLHRAQEHPGKCDVVFIGDSIMQGWEDAGKSVWTNYYGRRKCLNLGVGGDRTEHVLWRLAQGQLAGLKPKVAVLLIGTNNSNKNPDGSDQYSPGEILAGVRAVINEIRARLPETKLVVFGIFPRGTSFSPQRGKLLQVNQALAKLDDGKNIFYLDIGPQLIEADGTISKSMMRDALHPGERGYEIWAQALEPKLKQLGVPGKPLRAPSAG